MSRRPPTAPPDLPGFEHIKLLGSGGFADVFLYEQQLPRRRVAVKVLLPDRLESAGQQFAAEANVMAMLSSHPAIVTIHQAGMSADRRPYIVMEYCPRPNLQLRYRQDPFSVAETLRTAIPVIAAVETAHRMGVLHRDIKPANILVTEYNRPALTDFGIAANAGTEEEAAGMSIPWSPPESFAVPPRNGTSTDVYQLGATVYTLLAGRAPFEIPGRRNTSTELIDRAERMPLQRIDRPDVPASLQAALARAMAKRPEDRFPSAVAFARALQKVQIELEHSVTLIDIVEDSPTEEFDDENDGVTRVRDVTSILPDGDVTAGAPAPLEEQDHPTVMRARPAADPLPDAAEAPTLAPGSLPVVDPGSPLSETGSWTSPGRGAPARPPAPAWPVAGSSAETVDPPAGRRTRDQRPRWPWLVGGALVAAALIVGAVFALPPLIGDGAPDPEASTPQPQDPVTETPPPVEGLAGTVSGDEVTFRWTNPDPADGDRYQWSLDVAGGEAEFHDTRETRVSVPAAGDRTCIDVYLVRENGVASEAATACAP